MCLKTDTILLKYTFYQFQCFITTCLCTVEIYQEVFQPNSFNGNDLMWLGLVTFDQKTFLNKKSEFVCVRGKRSDGMFYHNK